MLADARSKPKDSAASRLSRLDSYLNTTTRLPDSKPTALQNFLEGIFVYRVNEAGKLLSMRGFWEFDRMLASMTAS